MRFGLIFYVPEERIELSHLAIHDFELRLPLYSNCAIPAILHINFVPEERIELSHLAIHDFESCASTNSAIPANTNLILL